MEFSWFERGSNHMMPLFMVSPWCGKTNLEPKVDNKVCVTAAMLPARSIT